MQIRQSCQLVVVAGALGLALVACGGGSDPDSAATTAPADPAAASTPATTAPATVPPTAAPATTAPPATTPEPTAPATTAPPATTPPTTEPSEPGPDDVSLDDEVAAGGGFVTMGIATGWNVVRVEDELSVTYEDAAGLEWMPMGDTVKSMIDLESGNATISVAREGRYGLVDDVYAWESAILDELGVQPNVQLRTDVDGGQGASTRGRIGSGYARLETKRIDGQIVSVLAFSPEQPTTQLDAEVSAMVDSMVIDTSVVDRLQHSIDLQSSVSAEDSGSTPFELSLLAPPNWIPDAEIEAFWYDPAVGPDAEQLPSLDVYTLLVDDTFEAVIAAEFDERAIQWLDVEPVAEDRIFNDVPFTIFWEGEPGEATAAIAMGYDGVVFAAAYIWTPEDPELLIAMVDSIYVPMSSFNPDGV